MIGVADLDFQLTRVRGILADEAPDWSVRVASRRPTSVGRLRELLGDEADALDVVLASVALQEDPLLARRLGVGVPGSSAGPSIVTLCALLNRAVPSLAEEGPVGTLAVLVPSVSDDGAAGPVHVPGHWISSLRGERELSGELSGCARRLEPHPDEAPALDPALLETVARFFEQRNSAGLAVALEGPVGTAAGLAGAFGRPLIEVDVARVARSLRAKTLLRILLTEAQLYDELVALRDPDALLDTAADLALTSLLAGRHACVLVLV